MLGIMRKYQKSPIIRIIFGIIIFSFVGTIFLIWGMDKSTPSSASYAIKVNGSKISFAEFDSSLQSMRGNYKNLTPEIEQLLNLKGMVMRTLVDRTLLLQEAKRLKIKVTDQEVQQAIQSIPAFQSNGAFDYKRYEQLVLSQRMWPKDFEAQIRQDLTIRRVQGEIEKKVSVDDQELLQAYSRQHDKINLVYLSYSPATVAGEVKLTDADLQEYLQRHADSFRSEEQVSVSYINVTASKSSPGANVTDQEAEAFYRRNQSRYATRQGVADFGTVREQVRADALRQKIANQTYEQAVAVTEKFSASGDIDGAAREIATTVNTTPLFTASKAPAPLNADPELLRRAMMLRSGELAGPIETKQGIFLLKLQKRIPSTLLPLDKVRGVISGQVLKEKAAELAKNKAVQALAQLKSGSLNGKGSETGFFPYAANGSIPGIGISAPLMEQAFKLAKVGEAVNEPVLVGDRWIAAALKGRNEADRSRFAQEKEALRQSLLPKLQSEAVAKRLDELRKSATIAYHPTLDPNQP
jgi:peptidyl-prolyl cis-trans isomerase D